MISLEPCHSERKKERANRFPRTPHAPLSLNSREMKSFPSTKINYFVGVVVDFCATKAPKKEPLSGANGFDVFVREADEMLHALNWAFYARTLNVCCGDFRKTLDD